MLQCAHLSHHLVLMMFPTLFNELLLFFKVHITLPVHKKYVTKIFCSSFLTQLLLTSKFFHYNILIFKNEKKILSKLAKNEVMQISNSPQWIRQRGIEDLNNCDTRNIIYFNSVTEKNWNLMLRFPILYDFFKVTWTDTTDATTRTRIKQKKSHHLTAGIYPG